MPAAGGAPLLAGAEGAVRTLLGVVEASAPVDRHGWAATLRVERELDAGAPARRGDAVDGEPERVRIAWEELAPGRPTRFRAGDRILVALVPLPGWSLWRKRFPQGDALAVAERGQAFLRDPSTASVDALDVYLRLPVEARESAAGVTALAGLVARAAPPLGEAAIERLRAVPGLATRLEAPAVEALGSALGDAGRGPALRSALAALAGERDLEPLRPALVRMTGEEPALAAAAWEALAALDDGLPPETVRTLARSRAPELRAVAARQFAAGVDPRRAARLAASDPSSEVRIAALRELARHRPPDLLDAALDLLFDPEPAVRAEAARMAASYGAEAVPRLQELAAAHSGREASGPLAALALAGDTGIAALRELAARHPDEQTRGMARVMLGREPFPEH